MVVAFTDYWTILRTGCRVTGASHPPDPRGNAAAPRLPAGVYFAELAIGDKRTVGKLVLMPR